MQWIFHEHLQVVGLSSQREGFFLGREQFFLPWAEHCAPLNISSNKSTETTSKWCHCHVLNLNLMPFFRLKNHLQKPKLGFLEHVTNPTSSKRNLAVPRKGLLFVAIFPAPQTTFNETSTICGSKLPSQRYPKNLPFWKGFSHYKSGGCFWEIHISLNFPETALPINWIW